MKLTFGNQILLLSGLSWLLAQLTKGLLQWITEGKVTLHHVLSSGGDAQLPFGAGHLLHRDYGTALWV